VRSARQPRLIAISVPRDLGVHDDVRTDYDVPSGAYGGDDEQIQGDRDVHPVARPTATLLTL
jgi:hypothetical protein